MCCLQDVRWRGCGARLIGLQGMKCKLWWSGNKEGHGGVGVMVKGALYDKVVEVRRVNDRVMSLVIVLEEVIRVVCAYAAQSGKLIGEKEKNSKYLSREWTTQHMSELIIRMGDLNEHVGINIDGFQEVHRGHSIVEGNHEGRMLLEFCDAKHICIANTWLRKADKKNITYGSGCNKGEIYFSIMGKVDRKFFNNVKVITGELQHNLVMVDIDKKPRKKTEWKPGSQRENVGKLRDEPHRQLNVG